MLCKKNNIVDFLVIETEVYFTKRLTSLLLLLLPLGTDVSNFFSFQDSEGLIVLNIGSYMGGVDLWQNDYEHDDDSFSIQSMHDKTLEVVCVRGAWHLGKLQV